MGLAISTSWNYREDPEFILDRIQEAGFREIELSFHFSKSRLKSMKELIRKFEMEVVSVHNFCPFPLEDVKGFPSPDFYSLSSKDEDERKRAVLATEATLETAYDLGARAVVLHCGGLDIEDKTRHLYELKRSDYEKFKEEIEKYLKLRSEKVKGHIDSLKFSLEKLLKKAERLGIKMGLESRYYLHEIPELSEVEEVLDCFRSEHLGNWHDVGHVAVSEQLEHYSQVEALNRLSDYLIGIHYHDVQGIDDHKPIGKGKIDFKIFKDFKPSINVLEVHSPATVEEVKSSKNYLEDLLQLL
jgi:sugar phosphate isomerase/epimerase